MISDFLFKMAERQFDDSAAQVIKSEPDAQGFYKSLTGKPPHEVKKSISLALCELVKKGELSDVDVINFESNNYISSEADAKLRAMS